jgi:hypothetical protein
MKQKLKQFILKLLKKLYVIPQNRKWRHFFEYLLFNALEKISGKQEFQLF